MAQTYAATTKHMLRYSTTISHNFTTYLGAPALQNLYQWRYAPAVLQQWFEGHLGLPDGVGIGLGQRGQEGGQLGRGGVSGRHGFV